MVPSPPASADTQQKSRFTRAELAVFVAGIASMGLEILAGRIVAPTFGSSVFTWGAVIGVFLTALSAGYWQGGRRASEHASETRLARLFVAATLFVGLVLVAGDTVLELTRTLTLPQRYEPLVPITILFGPPTYLLGFASPYAAELSARESTGAASGQVYALGTVGSIIGAFATTFVLIPSLPVTIIGLLFGGLLLGAALGLSAGSPREVTSIAVVALLLVIATTFAAVGTPGAENQYRTQTAYQELAVVDDDGIRTLYLDGQRHSAMDLDDRDRHVFTYTRYFHLPFLFADNESDIENVLFVGGGGFTGPKIFAEKYDVNIDVVELDPEVIRVAKEYFNVSESADFDIHQGDGRRFLERTSETYDLIILDAYRKDRVPFQLTTVEFMELARSKLSNDGVLLANLISAPTGKSSRFFRAEVKTMRKVFPQVYAFGTSSSNRVQNIEVIATKRETRLSQAQLQSRNDRRTIGIDLATAISHYIAEIPTADVPLLTDDHAPVDRLIRANVDQQYVIERANETTTPTATAAS